MDFYKFIYKRLGKKRTYLIIILILIVVSNLISVFLPVLQKKAIDNITVGILDKGIIAKMILISLGTIAISIISTIVIDFITSRLKRTLQEELIDSVILSDNEILKKRGAGAYLVSIFGDTEQIANLVSINIFEVIIKSIATISILIISIKWSLLFLEIVLPVYVIAIIIKIYSEKKYLYNYGKGRELVYEINPKVLEYIENRDTIISYTNISEYKTNLYSRFDERDKFFLKGHLFNDLESQFTKSINTIARLIFFISSIFYILDGKMELSSFIALNTYFSYIFLPLEIIKEFTVGIKSFEMLKNKIRSGIDYDIKMAIPRNHNLEMINCSFSYGDNEVISEISLNINKKIGLVGLSGEGKTTLIKLLLGESNPQNGECLYGGEKTFNLNKYILRTSIRYYKQEAELFDNSVKYNICLGKQPKTREDYERIKQQKRFDFNRIINTITKNRRIDYEDSKEILELFAIEKLTSTTEINIVNSLIPCSMETINELADIWVSRNYYIQEKYNSLISDLKLEYLENRVIGQRGNKISGGEKNKVIVARFLLSEYGDKYIIDEPFTSLDKIAEQESTMVMKEYIKHMQGITISHKLDVINSLSDSIVILENGVITGYGTSEDLYEKNNLYKKLKDASANTVE